MLGTMSDDDEKDRGDDEKDRDDEPTGRHRRLANFMREHQANPPSKRLREQRAELLEELEALPSDPEHDRVRSFARKIEAAGFDSEETFMREARRRRPDLFERE